MTLERKACCSFLLSVDMLATLHCHVSQQFLQPGLPLVGAMKQQGTTWVQQSHCSIAVQLLQAAMEGPTALLQQGAHLCLQTLTLANQVGLACVLQEGCSWHIARRT